MKPTGKYWRWLIAFALLAATVFFIFAPLTPTVPYPYDSADYMYAGLQGFWVNYTDAGSLSVSELLEKGSELLQHPEKRAQFSREIRERKDIGFYRHFHGPMYTYWIALCAAFGASSEYAFRNAGFIIHIASSLILMAAFWNLFPKWSPLAGFAAGVMLLFNRTALVTTTAITQHLVFLPLAILTLWALSRFCREYEEKWWYATAAFTGLAFAAVETAVLLVATTAVMLLFSYREIASRWPSWGSRFMLLLKGVGIALLVILVVWPAGILKLGLARGFGFLGYMALSRKSFSLHGPLDTWRDQFTSAPFEHWMMLAGFIASIVLWKRFEHRRESLPWIVYAFVYILITTKITLDYKHYRGTIAVAGVMMTAMAIAHLWTRWKPRPAGRAVLVILTAAGVAGEAVRYYDYLQNYEPTASAYVLEYVEAAQLAGSRSALYVPYYFVPALHFYYPNLPTIGYDKDWPVTRLISELRQPEVADEFLCVQSACREIARAARMESLRIRQIAPNHEGEPLYVMGVPR